MTKRTPGRALAGATLALAFAFATPAPARAPTAGIDFAGLAEDFRSRRPGADLEEVLARHYVVAHLGCFDVYYPADRVVGKDDPDPFKRSVAALIDLQGAWVELFGEGPGAKQALKQVQILRKWAHSGRTFSRLDPRSDEEARDFFAVYGAEKKQLAARAELVRLFESGEALGFAPVDGRAFEIVLAPDRADFQAVLSFVGSLDPSLRGIYWHDGVRTWTEFFWNDLQVVALQYAPFGGDADVAGAGIAMDEREETGLEQHVAQRGAIALAWRCFGDGLTPPIELGLAQTLVIDVYEQNNIRSGGATRGSATEGMTAFIPGGNSGGGALPALNADSSWRADLGEDYFAEALRAAQKSASKRAPKGGAVEKSAWFQLVAADTASKYDVRAPFFGAGVVGKELPPEAHMQDYLEFYRAYKTCFVDWLRKHGAGSKTKSAQAFSRLGRRIAEEKGAGDFEAIVTEVYGMPLGAAGGDADSLEAAFLHWLSKG